jgi:hypothetical protein
MLSDNALLAGDLNLIQPPVDTPMPMAWFWLFTVFCAIPLLVFIGYAVWAWRRKRTLVPLLLIVGGIVATGLEPVWDVLGLCWFPRGDSTTLFEAFGRPMPIFLPLAYGWFLGGLALWFLRRFQTGATFTSLVRGWLVLAVVSMILETPAVTSGVYVYYGGQPFNLWGFPLWWPINNALLPVTLAFLLFKAMPYLVGWHALAVIPLVPSTLGISYGATAWPIFMTLNTEFSYGVKTIAAVASLGLVFLALKAMSTFATQSDRESAPSTARAGGPEHERALVVPTSNPPQPTGSSVS